MEQNTKICKSCERELPATTEYFYSVPEAAGGLKRDCRDCCREYRKERYRLYKDPNYKKKKIIKREELVNPYPDDTLEADLWIHFNRMGKQLSADEISSIRKRVIDAQLDGRYFAVMDQIESEYGVGKKDYNIDLPELLRQDRAMEFELRPPSIGGKDIVSVEQYDMEGNYIETFKSISDASEVITGSRLKAVGGITNCCKGINRHAIGFIWRYKTDC